MRADLGARLHVTFSPPASARAKVQALDASGFILWEGEAWQAANFALPLQTVSITAQDDAGHRGAKPIALLANSAGQSIVIELN